uniref:Porin n=1 Tax=Oscillatoriales cyanobacterium SpSt-402 TaxID=2282168 RepID=A0A832H3U3_9CYAN
MKSGLNVLLVLATAIAPISPAIAQVEEAPLSTTVHKQTDSLLAEPLEIGQSPASSHRSALNPERLTNVAGSIQAKPGNNLEPAGIPSDLIPKDLIRTSSKPLSDSHPLEVFQGSAPNPSVGINLNKL